MLLTTTPTIGERPRHYRGGRPPTYANLYMRLVANTTLSNPDDPNSCWVWIRDCDKHGYPRVGMRIDDGDGSKVRKFYAHRLMLEMATGYQFPFDDAGHLCANPSCINPTHLEIQTPSFNLSERRGYMPVKDPGRMIPILFPIEDPIEAMLEMAEESMRLVGEGEACPF